MRRLRIISVGRIKTAHWREAAAHYVNRLPHGLSFQEDTVKDGDAKLPLTQRKEAEGARMLKLLRPADVPLCLDEHGRTMSSEDFAAFLNRHYQTAKIPCFLIGGAYGLARSVLEQASEVISLGPMTFPHELARVLLLEQIYRAENIMAGTGYHH